MRVLHISDNHGLFIDFWSLYKIDPKSIDVIAHSGDFCPNWSRGIRAIEEPRQESWLLQNVEKIAGWTKDLPVLFVPGNHDFVNVAQILKGLNFIDLCKKTDEGDLHPLDMGGYRWLGSPYVPWFTGEWNYELSEKAEEIAVSSVIAKKPDIIVSHGPIKGVLDRNGHGDRCGSRQWALQLKAAINDGWQTKAFLHGHLHECGGAIIQWKNMIISNAATTYRILDI